MTDPRLEDHMLGLELQLVELVEQEQRAEVQGRDDDAAALEPEIAVLQQELAATAEVAALTTDEPAPLEEHAQVLAPTVDELVDGPAGPGGKAGPAGPGGKTGPAGPMGPAGPGRTAGPLTGSGGSQLL